MGTIVDNNGEKRELDDSGCIQDDSSQLKMTEPEENGYPAVTLLDLSDDVLLYILRHCSPRDLKALGFSCPRLGRLVRERSLWRRVDARSERCGAARLKWYVTHALHSDTRELLLRGYADEAQGCVGLLNCTRKEAEEEQRSFLERKRARDRNVPSRVPPLHRYHACLYVSAHSSSRLPRYRGTPLWADDDTLCRPRADAACAGPRFTATEPLLGLLRARCPALTRLALDYCNIAANVTNLGHLPPTLKQLSLRGTKCFNLTVDKSFLFKIQDHLPLLESLDVSECEWMEPASLLPLSKHSALRELYMRDCYRLTEFVAYASLSSRYGFRKLEILDLRGSPVGDSEVAPLAWLPELQQLKLSAVCKPLPLKHAHYVDDTVARRRDLDDWEMEEPDYFRQHIPDGDKATGADSDASVCSGDDAPDTDDDDDDDFDDDTGDFKGFSRCKFSPQRDGAGKTDEPSAPTKRKAENGSGDASVNGDTKRPKSDKNNRKRDFAHDPMSTEEERYEKRRCQTIVIVDRRTYDENVQDDLVPPEIEAIEAELGPSDERRESPPQNEQDGTVEVIEIVSGQQASEANASDETEAKENEKDEKGPKKDEKGPEKDEKGPEKDEKPEKEERDVDNVITHEAENLKQIDLSCNTERPKEPKTKDDEVNKGASTSRDCGEDSTNNDGTVERCVRFRHGEPPVLMEMDPRGSDASNNPAESPEEEDSVHRRMFERARLMERNPHIMNLIRNIDLRDPPPAPYRDVPRHRPADRRPNPVLRIRKPARNIEAVEAEPAPGNERRVNPSQNEQDGTVEVTETVSGQKDSEANASDETEAKEKEKDEKGPEKHEKGPEKDEKGPKEDEKSEKDEKDVDNVITNEAENLKQIDLSCNMEKPKESKTKDDEVNRGASTSRDRGEDGANNNGTVERCVRFRHGEPPVLMEMDPRGRDASNNPAESPEEEDSVHRRMFERARLMERNPHIMNLMRNVDPRDPPPAINRDVPRHRPADRRPNPVLRIRKPARNIEAVEVEPAPSNDRRVNPSQNEQDGTVEVTETVSGQKDSEANASDETEAKEKEKDEKGPEKDEKGPEKDEKGPKEDEKPEKDEKDVDNVITNEAESLKQIDLSCNTERPKEPKTKDDEVNKGASTSRDCGEDGANNNGTVERCVRFRHGEPPVLMEMDPRGRDASNNPAESPEEEDSVHRRMFERARLMERNPHIMNLMRNVDPRDPPPAINRDVPRHRPADRRPNPVLRIRNPAHEPDPPEPEGEQRHRVLYVNVGQPANAYGPIPHLLQAEQDRLVNAHRSHLTPSALVTDSAVRRFGRSAGTDIRFVLVGLPHPFLGPNGDYNNRPDRSSLRALVMNGYRNVTDRSLVHLATAAPLLRFLDFRETGVTPLGVENFRSLRPDVELLYSPYRERSSEPKERDD